MADNAAHRDEFKSLDRIDPEKLAITLEVLGDLHRLDPDHDTSARSSARRRTCGS